ncbi:hypothetical protein EPI10_021190 [Gossypium australe]|uniref:Uncharacterized protein n=1 Tax=Gossypium australe TaxID=47621 RepID=A0A5B6WHR9_9ROSI|nr:hypothetical protein EPI10_021190 [Gossypium australe]
MDWITAGHNGLFELNEIEELKAQACENTKLYKEKTKRWYEKRIMLRQFEQWQQVFLFNSRLKLFPGPFDVSKAYPHGVVDIKDTEIEVIFKVNGQHLKHYGVLMWIETNNPLTFEMFELKISSVFIFFSCSTLISFFMIYQEFQERLNMQAC